MSVDILSVDEQISHLKKQGLKVGEDAYDILLSVGYYCLIDGYRVPFLDYREQKAEKRTRYKKGVSFDDIYGLYLFDKSLNAIIFPCLLMIERKVKALFTYTFYEAHPEVASYLDPKNYVSKDKYILGTSAYDADMASMMQTYKNNIAASPCCKRGSQQQGACELPLWQLVNELTFGNINHIYDLLSRPMQNRLCERICALSRNDSQKPMNPRELSLTLRTLVEFRDICAHDDRLYCMKIKSFKTLDFFDALAQAEDLMTVDETNRLRDRIYRLSKDYSDKSKALKAVLYRYHFLDETPSKVSS
ncbi:MAG: Abi family protein [Eggerthellaceae bacterium]|nr:Abi family protein [Eggerthellaceae bacterium]